MNPVLTKYPVDLTGRNSNNLVSGEEHLLLRFAGVTYRVVVMDHGGFYTQGMVVYDKDFNELVPNIDYICTYAYADASKRVGMEIMGAIVILNQALLTNVYVSAQMVGGDYAFSLTEQEDTLAYLRTLGAAVPPWGGYVGVRPLWIDGELERERWQLDGYQPFNIELENIAKALMAGDQDALMLYRNNARQLHDAFVAQFDNRLQLHIDDHNDPHDIQAVQVGLGLVVNKPLASTAIAAAGLSDAHYITPAQTKAMVQARALDPLAAHKALQNNPHGLTPGQAGTLTQAQVDGLVNSKLPLNATADNAAGILNGNEILSFGTAVDRTRQALDASLFTGGVFDPGVLGGGGANYETLLLGNGQYTSIASIFAEFAVRPTGAVYWGGGTYASPAQAVQNIAASYGYGPAYPAGTIVFFRWVQKYTVAVGNGGGSSNITTVGAAVRTPSGWIQL